jgi:hypothetical protein
MVPFDIGLEEILAKIKKGHWKAGTYLVEKQESEKERTRKQKSKSFEQKQMLIVV